MFYIFLLILSFGCIVIYFLERKKVSVKSAQSESVKKILLTVIKYIAIAGAIPFVANFIPIDKIQEFLQLIAANVDSLDEAIYILITFVLAAFAKLKEIFQKGKMQVIEEPSSLLKSAIDTRL